MILSSATEQTLLAALKAVLSHEEGALEQVRAASNLVEADANCSRAPKNNREAPVAPPW